jgi:DNA-binding response OmpR family regulator
MRILIIDDDPQVGNLLAEVLRARGHTPAVARSGAEGLAAIAAEPPDAVFLDMVMPGISGLDVLREIRRTHRDLPVLVLTGRATDEQLEEARRLGFTDVVEKPWALTNLDAALESLEPPAAGQEQPDPESRASNM